jgi:peptidoglycan-associated lipoprotein
MVMVVGVAGMLASTGCATKRRTGGASTEGDGTFVEGDILTSDTAGAGAAGMLGERFDSGALAKVEGAAFSPVYFGYDNYQIPSSEYSKIDAVANLMRANGSIVLVVEGHCDERGTTEYNMSLGEYRAQSVRSYLVNAGIATDRIQTASYGEERPAATGTGESSWQLNRRSEFALYQR